MYVWFQQLQLLVMFCTPSLAVVTVIGIKIIVLRDIQNSESGYMTMFLERLAI